MIVRKIYKKHTSSGAWHRSATSSSVSGSTGSLQLKQIDYLGAIYQVIVQGRTKIYTRALYAYEVRHFIIHLY